MAVQTIRPHEDRRTATARAAHIEARGYRATIQRGMAIGALPAVIWRGRTLRTIRCRGERGRDPHVQHVPESLLWSLIDLRVWRCPYHA
jgi:hypothetical protein